MMATTIKTKNSTTAATAPTGLVQGELAVNITDKKLYVGDSVGNSIQIAGAGATNAAGGSNTQVQYNSSGALAGSSSFVFDGTNVGIGTSSPSVKLDVQSSTGAVACTATTGTNASTFRAINTGGTFYVGLDTSTGSSFSTGGYGAVLWHSGAYPIVFATNSTEKMRLDSSGNLGLGVTPSAWASTYTALQVKNFGLMSKNDSSWQYTNAYYDGSNKYVSNGYAGAFDFNGAATGGYAWRIAPSGTAGNAITFTQAMTLDANGNLGIGTTSPAYKLHAYSSGANIIGSEGTTDASFITRLSGTQALYLNSTSGSSSIIELRALPLLFSTNATERMRIDSSGALGFSGANYGTSGQVLTSNGSASAPSWQAVSVSSATVLSAIAGASFGDVGTYAWLNYNGTTPFTQGTTVAGSSLLAAGTFSNVTITGDGSYNGGTNFFTAGGSALSGTWRAMSRSNTNSGSNYARMGLWLRIS